MKSVELSLVIPCYNEGKNLPLLIERLQKILENNSYEVILVDNGSKDNSNRLIKEYCKKYSQLKIAEVETNIGYGNGIYTGLLKARGEYVGWTHADLQTDPNDVMIAFDLIKKQNNPDKSYVKGRRYGRPLFDKLFTLGMSIFETLILFKALYDINAQPNVFHRSFLDVAKDPPKEFSFDLYFYYMAKRNNYRIVRFPVHFGKRIYGESSWNTGLKARWKLIKRTLGFSFRLKNKLK